MNYKSPSKKNNFPYYLSMLIYYEKKAQSYYLTQSILDQFPHAEKIAINHYKDLFDKSLWNYPTQPCILLAKQDPIPLLPTPPNYGYPGKSFFFKPSLNCIFDCNYCYLKGMFKNRFPVIFVNYPDIQSTIDQQIKKLRTQGYHDQITFYASNYSDLLAIEHLTHFHQHFIPFFEHYDNVLMETRTKSANIDSLIVPTLWNPLTRGSSDRTGGFSTVATEIAFSLSPAEIAHLYEPGTASLDQKLQAITTLLDLGYRVGLRFLPLLPVQNYETIYKKLIDQVKTSIAIERISSIFIAPLLYNAQDFAIMKKKYPQFPFRTQLTENQQGIMKMGEEHYEKFYQLFSAAFTHHTILRDYR